MKPNIKINMHVCVWGGRNMWKCLRKSSRRHDCQLICELDLSNCSLPPLQTALALECVFYLSSPIPEADPRIQHWDRNVVLRLSGLGTWLNPVKSSIQTFQILAGRCRDLFILRLPKTGLVSKFPCLSNLPSTTLEWSVYFFLSLPSLYQGWFQITPRKFLRTLQNSNTRKRCKQDLEDRFAHSCSSRIIHNSPRVEATEVSIHRGMDGQNMIYMIYIYDEILFSF